MIGRLIFALTLAGATLATAQVSDDGATDINPFKTPTPQSSNNSAIESTIPTSLDQFQFNGMMEWNGRMRVSVFDAKANKSYWLNEGELNELGLSFQRLDWENDTVVISQGGVQKKLALNKMKIEPLRIATPRTPAVMPPASGAVTRAAPAGNVETDEEARARIQRVAEEIRRRRAERRKQLEERNKGGSN